MGAHFQRSKNSVLRATQSTVLLTKIQPGFQYLILWHLLWHSMHIVPVHFINLLLTRRAQDFDFKSHLRVWKPLLSSNCLPLGHCYYYMLIYIYIFCLEVALYLLSPVFLPDTEDKNSNQHGTSARAHSWPHPHYLQPFSMFHWLFSKPRGLSCKIPEKLVLSSSAKNIHFV